MNNTFIFVEFLISSIWMHENSFIPSAAVGWQRTMLLWHYLYLSWCLHAHITVWWISTIGIDGPMVSYSQLYCIMPKYYIKGWYHFIFSPSLRVPVTLLLTTNSVKFQKFFLFPVSHKSFIFPPLFPVWLTTEIFYRQVCTRLLFIFLFSFSSFVVM